MKVSPGFEDPSARPEITLAARLLLVLTAVVVFAALLAIDYGHLAGQTTGLLAALAGAMVLVGITEELWFRGIGVNVFSPESPLGAALVGHATGETVDFEQPNGKTAKIEILSAVPFTS